MPAIRPAWAASCCWSPARSIFLAIGFAGFALADAFLAYPAGYAKPLIIVVEVTLTLSIGVTLGLLAAGPPARIDSNNERRNAVWSLRRRAGGPWLVRARSPIPQPLRKILAFNVLGSGVFLLFGVIARRGAAAGLGADPVPQALVITGIVVAFSATAMAVALLLRLFKETGQATLAADDAPKMPSADGDRS